MTSPASFVIRFRTTLCPDPATAFVCFQAKTGVMDGLLRSTRSPIETAGWPTADEAREFLRSLNLHDGARVPVGIGDMVAEVAPFDRRDFERPRCLGALFESRAERLKHAETVAATATFYAKFAVREPVKPAAPAAPKQAAFAFD